MGVFKKPDYFLHVYLSALWLCFPQFTVRYSTEHLVQGILWVHKSKAELFPWGCFSKQELLSPGKFQTLTFKSRSVKILVEFILLCSLSFVMCGKIQVSLCSITAFHFPAESSVPVCDPGCPRWGIILRNHFKVKFTF